MPYSGAPPACMVLCYDKQIVRLLAQSEGVPVPREIYLGADGAPDIPADLYPALIKPNQADGSIGIRQDAVVRSSAEAAEYVAWLRAELPGRALLVQEYLPGPEYGIGLIGNPVELVALPPLEVDFTRLPAGLNPILSYRSRSCRIHRTGPRSSSSGRRRTRRCSERSPATPNACSPASAAATTPGSTSAAPPTASPG